MFGPCNAVVSVFSSFCNHLDEEESWPRGYKT